MKHLIFALCIIFSIRAHSQNGGQYAENSYGKMNFVSYSNGNYLLSRTNLQPCAVEIKVDWLDKDTTILIPGSTTVIITLPGAFVGNSHIKSRPLTNCTSGDGDMGWLEIRTPIALPLVFKYFRSAYVSPNKIKLELSVTGTEDENSFNLRTSFDGITYQNIAVILPNDGEYVLYVEKLQKPDGTIYFKTTFK